MSTAAVYVRVSSRKQAMAEKTSLADQEKECRAYAAREGWPVAGAFIDTMTGYETMDQRPALQEVRQLIKTSGADVLIVWRYDRAARDQIDLLMLAREVNAAGAKLVSATEGAMENTATGRMLLGVLGGAAEIEREAIIARTQGAIRTRAESGKILIGGGPKYGYVYAGERKERYEINPETAPVVQRMFQMADDGKSLHDIQRVLNDEGIPPPSLYLAQKGQGGNRAVAQKWRRQGIYILLKDPTYMGKHIAYRRKKVKGQTTMALREPGDEKLIEQTVPAIVTVEQWTRVQQSLSEHMLRRNSATDPEQIPLLNRGLSYCGHCGSRAIGAKHNRGWWGYRCQNKPGTNEGSTPPCTGGHWFVRADHVDREVWAKVQAMMADTERFREMMLAPLQEAQAKLERAEGQEARLTTELEQARKDRETISRRMATEEDDAIAATFRARLKETLVLIARLEARLADKDHEVERMQRYLATLFSAASGWQDAQGNAVDPEAILTAIAPTPLREQKRNLLKAIGVKVVFYSSKSDWTKENGKRWDMQIIPGLYTPGTHPRADTFQGTHIYRWEDWLRAGRKRRKAS